MKVVVLTVLLVCLVYIIFLIISYKIIRNEETSSGYECGFNFITKTRINFSYRFFLIGILFLIFDVEIVLFLSIPYLTETFSNFIVISIFITILIVGLLYEYYCGSLNWL